MPSNENAYVHMAIDPIIKNEATAVLSNFGLTVPEICRMLLTEIAEKKHPPYAMEIPNKETQEVLEASERGEELHHVKDIDDLFKQLGI